MTKHIQGVSTQLANQSEKIYFHKVYFLQKIYCWLGNDVKETNLTSSDAENAAVSSTKLQKKKRKLLEAGANPITLFTL